MTAAGSLSKNLTLEEFTRFRDYIHEHSGIYLEEGKLDSLRISLVTRATRLAFDSFGAYFDVLSHNEDEFKELMSLITINETSFMRFPAQFEALRAHVLPEIMEGRHDSNRAMRVWSAGCSTGEEPYSVAMSLLDSGIQGLGWQGYVYGTDVSTKALTAAREGVYGRKAMVNVPEDVVARHFTRRDASFRVADHVRELVEFGYHNLIKEPYPLSLMGSWDVIFCRNVTIYFKLDSTRRVVANFFNSLNPGGYLFVGHSETLSSISDDFEPIETGGVFLYRKPRPHRFHFFNIKEKPAPSVTEPVKERRHARRVEPAPDGAEHVRKGKRARSEDEAVASRAQAAGGLAAARERLVAGDPDAALAIVEDVLATDRNDAEANVLAAYVYADIDRLDEAFAAAHRALAVNPLLPVARYILGLIYMRQGNSVMAVSEMKKTVYIEPDFALAHLNLANIHRSQRKWEAACREYENAKRSLESSPQGAWTAFLGGFDVDLLAQTCERSLVECRKAMGVA
ncbi:MAG: CheR family methyltransferase [Coriobacteriia bacterium]